MKLIPSYKSLSDAFEEILKYKDENLSVNNLLMLFMGMWGFDEVWYLESNPDLFRSIPSDVFPTGFSHFRAVGYSEGRLPIKPVIDSSWYMSNYPDVASAIIKGAFESATHHFLGVGYSEGRLPCDPEIDVEWYMRTYLPSAHSAANKGEECLRHFMNGGYVNGALPRRNMN